tara:strand:- start:92 stop:379 length:288 start_codon:yes stop_codon:yes gene_type:complete
MFAPNPEKSFDLTRRLPLIITESITLKLIRTDSINKLTRVAIIKKLRNLKFLKSLIIIMKLNATKKFNIFSNSTTPSERFSATNNEIVDITTNKK